MAISVSLFRCENKYVECSLCELYSIYTETGRKSLTHTHARTFSSCFMDLLIPSMRSRQAVLLQHFVIIFFFFWYFAARSPCTPYVVFGWRRRFFDLNLCCLPLYSHFSSGFSSCRYTTPHICCMICTLYSARTPICTFINKHSHIN